MWSDSSTQETRPAWRWLVLGLLLALVLSLSAGCRDNATTGSGADDLAPLLLPELQPVELAGRPLQVVATTSIIGDMVAEVGGTAIALTTIIAPGQDPHSYEPAVADMASAADADVIYVNGWNLEEGLIDNLASAAGGVPMVPVSANIEPLPFGVREGEEVEGAGMPDPHTWLDPHLAIQWLANIEQSLQALDPANASTYATNAAAYRSRLDQLIAEYDRRLGQLPDGGRRLVTNHDALGYLAAAYDLDVIGTVIPGASTLAEPSAGALVNLARIMNEAGVCTIFVETTNNDELARAVAAELENCPAVKVLTLHTGALGLPGRDTDSYIGMMQVNLEAIADGLT